MELREREVHVKFADLVIGYFFHHVSPIYPDKCHKDGRVLDQCHLVLKMLIVSYLYISTMLNWCLWQESNPLRRNLEDLALPVSYTSKETDSTTHWMDCLSI